MKIVLLTRHHAPTLESLSAEFPAVDFVLATSPDEARAAVVDADAMYGLPSRDVFRAARKVRWIHCPGTGVDPIWSVPEFVDSDVILTNARGPHAAPMADHVFAQLLALVHHLPRLIDDQRARRWDMPSYDEQIVPLEGRTLGILALGGIGRAVAERGRGFGLLVRGFDPGATDVPDWIGRVADLDELLAASDVFVVTAPLTPQTRGLLDRRRIGLLPRGSYLMVISRGGIVDEEALADALQEGRLAGAGLDVTAREPLPPTSRLWDAPNILISPHVSALTPEMWEGRRQIFRENLRRWLSGRDFLYVVDKEAGY